ncbi:Adenosylmethionine-8-amino-7-oxononanoate aminotransferase [compost metagenome]
MRGCGLIAAVELVGDKDSKAPYQATGTLGRYLAGRAQQHGLITRAMGDAIAFCPPLIIDEQEMGLLLERFERALEDTAQWAK